MEPRSSQRTRYPGIYKVTRGTTVRYMVSYRLRGRGQQTKTFRTLAEAREFQGRIRNPDEARRLAELTKGRVSLSDFFDQWLSRKRKLAEGTRVRYEGVGRLYIQPFILGSMWVADIRPDHVEAWIAELVDQGTPPFTIDKAYRTLRACLSAAVREGKALNNPARGIELPTLARRQPFFLTAAEVDAIAQEMDSRDRALTYFLAYTGARIGEATALRLRHLDMLRRRATIAENSPEVAGRKLPPGKTKSGRVRTVPIPEALAIELARYLETLGERDSDSFVFVGSRGAPLRQNNWRGRVFQPAAIRVGVVRQGRHGDEPPRVHDLRHTFASLAADSGYTLHEVKEMLGHSTIQTTSDLYMHLFPDSLQQKADRLGASIGSTTVGSDVMLLRPPR
jgi:integrase